ncbi:MAG: YbhB/YbcL family Raf kinase inhibitor-like protein [Deferribacteres bacterium]|nr:YbhB/YbcL family Raf kinase inhibitor-like protein [candidate division KSB1 bacterium]MCB9501131.1 YbhB/YbcL family Raf kinase inhibitor-like protein [Deferribacteres bacterium]
MGILLISVVVTGIAFAGEFKLSSSSIDKVLTDEQVYNGFGCSGKNISPALKWSNAPEGTMSYAVTVYDPDAPTGSGWWHWLVYNIPANIRELPEGAGDVSGNMLPEGAAQGRTDFGTKAFGGACPPKGDKPHRYIFTVFALKVAKIDVPAEATAALIGYMLNANAVGKASFTATYGR